MFEALGTKLQIFRDFIGSQFSEETLSTKKTKLNIEKWPEILSRSHVRILIYRMWAIDMKMSYYSHTNKTHLHTEGFARSLVLKVRVLELENGLFTFPVRSFLL